MPAASIGRSASSPAETDLPDDTVLVRKLRNLLRDQRREIRDLEHKLLALQPHSGAQSAQPNTTKSPP